MRTAIWWARRDLRLGDNPALSAALEHADQVLPAFVIDPALLASDYVGKKRLAFLFEGLRQLDADLRARGSRLTVRRGDPAEVLAQVVEDSGAGEIFAERDYSPYAKRRDEQVGKDLRLNLLDGVTARPPGTVLKGDGEFYTVFTPFSRTWKSQPPPTRADLLPAPTHIPTPEFDPGTIPTEPALPEGVPFEAGEGIARRRLSDFTEGANPAIAHYHAQRDRVDLASTSGMSPYLRFGMISAREAVVAAYEAIEAARNEEAREGAEKWLDELIWREFFIHILERFPRVRAGSFHPVYDNIQWENDDWAFQAWCAGRTGYPLIDAGMRQLAETGWMHNRARMITASFLVKDLLIDWRWGELWFMRHLVDGDPAANNGGWQWSAGTGTDAAVYFRVFNPTSQAKKHDPDGAYIRRWVPELRDAPDKLIHTPWRIPADDRHGYPNPIVDHKWARQRALAAYARAREEEKR
ncbi:MAG: deoxyribodipyrimidine photo-lyase [Chloroflexota bacterium]